MKSRLSFVYFTNMFKYKFNFTKMISIPLVLCIYYKFFDSNSCKKIFLFSSNVNFKKILLPEPELLKEGELREIKFGRNPGDCILIVKIDNKLHAISNYCPYNGAEMHKGQLIDNIIKCHLDGSTFDIYTGFCETAPSLDGLNKYEIIRNPVDRKLYAMVDLNSIRKGKVQIMSKRDLKNKQKFVIIGGGPAALSCAETLRQSGFTGEISIFTDEDSLPYDRSQLSKISSVNDYKIILLRDESFLSEYEIEFVRNTKVMLIDSTEKAIKLSNGAIKNYDKLLIATGSSARVPLIQGYDLNNVYTLRNHLDLKKIKQSSEKASKIVIVGASFNGMEMSSFLKKLNPKAEIILIDSQTAPFEKAFGTEIGQGIQRLHENNGIKFILEKNLFEIKEKPNTKEVGKVILINSRDLDCNYKKLEIDCDLVLLATGITPNSDFLNSVITLENKQVKCDAYLCTSDPNIFTAGDVSLLPSIFSAERMLSQHYNNAEQQGSIAALNMLGKNIPYDYTPFFSAVFFDKSIQFVGNSENYDELLIDGNLFEFTFKAYYFKNKKLIGFASMNSPNSANLIYEIMRSNYLVSSHSIRNGEFSIEKIKQILNRMNVKSPKIDCVCSSRLE